MFSATAAADFLQRFGVNCDVIVFEGTSKTMSKVRISGGGRVSRQIMHTAFLATLFVLILPHAYSKHQNIVQW